jgi:hypothetical protein
MYTNIENYMKTNPDNNNLPDKDMDPIPESPKTPPPLPADVGPKDNAGPFFIDSKSYHEIQEKSKQEQMARRFASVRHQWAIAQYPLRKAIKADNREYFDAILKHVSGDFVDLCIVGLTWFGDSRLYDTYMSNWGDGIEFTDLGLLRSLRSEAPAERRKSVQGILVMDTNGDEDQHKELIEKMMDIRDAASEILMTRLKRSKTQNIL